MKNPKGKKLEKIIFKLFDDASQGVDRYNHNGSLWAIFTNETKWVVEFTKDQTLWYNYNFFKDEMELIGLDCVEDKDLIQKWFESRFLGMPKVEEAFDPFFDQDQYVEDTIQNVKDISSVLYKELLSVEDTIQNGVKHTLTPILFEVAKVEDAIENGVKLTELSKRDFFPKDILKGGVKETKSLQIHLKKSIKDTIQKGVKETIGTLRRTKLGVDDIIQKGVRHTAPDASTIVYAVEDTIQNGVKMTKSTIISQDSKVEDTLQNGVKETKSMCGKRNGRISNTIENGVKETIGTLRSTCKWGVDDIIKNGVKHVEDGDWLDGDERFNDIIQSGVKKTDEAFYGQVYVEDIIQEGVKNLGAVDYDNLNGVEDIIQNGVKETYDDCSNNIARVEGIIRIGEKIS